MKYNIGDKVFSVSTLSLWDNPYSYKNGFSHCIQIVKTAKEERFSTGENVDTWYPSIGDYVYYQSTGCDIHSDERLLHLEKDVSHIHELISSAHKKALNEAKIDRDKKEAHIKSMIDMYQDRLEHLKGNPTDQESLIKERYSQLRDTLFPI
jgi:hypothetical protein